jgi:hypothetical protein
VTILDLHHWTVKTHKYHICSLTQRACARTVLLVGVRLYNTDISGEVGAAMNGICNAKGAATAAVSAAYGDVAATPVDDSVYCSVDICSEWSVVRVDLTSSHTELVRTSEVSRERSDAGPTPLCGRCFAEYHLEHAVPEPPLPALPDEVWILVLTWLRRADLGWV